MSKIEALRCKLYAVWEKGSSREILKVSQELDIEIVKYMKRSLANQKQVFKEQERRRMTAVEQRERCEVC